MVNKVPRERAEERDEHWNTMLRKIEADYRDPAKFGIKHLLGDIPYILNNNRENNYEANQEREFKKY